MFLFSRRTRLVAGHGRAPYEWAVDMCHRVNAIVEPEVQLWTTMFSAGTNTVSWTSIVPDLAALETSGDKLQLDDGFILASDEGATFTTGELDDALFEIVAGEIDPAANPQYVTAVEAVCANGNIAKGMAVGVELATRAEAITGYPTLFVHSVTGPYAGVGWLTGYPDVAELQRAQHAVNADADFLAYLDSEARGAFVEDPDRTMATIYRKLA